VHGLPWEAPAAGDFDALLLTSANAPRHAGAALSRYRDLRCYCVGEATADAAREAGLGPVRVGPADGAASVELMAGEEVRRALHLAGREHRALTHPAVGIERRIVYASDPLPLAQTARDAIARGALVLLHSSAAAAHFARLAAEAALPRERVRIAAISPAAASAAGKGWAEIHVAPAPRDPALLALAAELCKNGPASGTGTGE
jgi:uroporphyrinogen-III synthase